MITTEQKIKAFGDLEEGWHFGIGTPITKLAVDIALDLNAIKGKIISDVFPEECGGLEYALYREENRYGFLISFDGKIEYRLEVNDKDIEIRDITLLEAKNIIFKLNEIS